MEVSHDGHGQWHMEGTSALVPVGTTHKINTVPTTTGNRTTLFLANQVGDDSSTRQSKAKNKNRIKNYY
jgi:hypothetical protein